jgi:hypothetical protein
MQFRLTYEGPLKASGNNNRNSAHKHEIRKAFHPQLKNLWANNANLNALAFTPMDFINNPLPLAPRSAEPDPRTYVNFLADNYALKDHRIVPLVTEGLSLWCGLDILFLRWSPPGKVLSSGDIDNRIKTLFDALKRPSQLSDFGPEYVPPTGPEDNPLFVLLEDDCLVAKLSVETDTMLEPLMGGIPQDSDTRLVITVTLRPINATIQNMGLF